MVSTQNKVENRAEAEKDLPFLQKLCTFRYHRPAELQQMLVSVIGFTLIIAGLAFTVQQMKANADAFNQTVEQNIMSHTLDVDKLFIDSPDLRPYFFNGKKISPSDRNYNKALAIADYQLDFFYTFFTQSPYWQSFRKAETQHVWNQYMHAAFKQSPIMCQQLKAYGLAGEYSPKFVDKFKTDCPSDFSV